MKGIALAISIAMMLSGCAGGFNSPPPGSNYGIPPLHYEETIRQHMEVRLKDAESARYRFDNPVRAYGNSGLIHGGEVSWTGWAVRTLVNAKNSYGGYTGYKPHIFCFSGETIYRHVEGDSHPLLTMVGD